MPKKKSRKDERVVSLESARRRRELDEAVARIHATSKTMTDHVAELVATYHAWEAAYPDKAVSDVDKLEMVQHGFVGASGFERCGEEHRLPGLALYGMQAEMPCFGSEVSEQIMCPALESGRCRPVLETFDRPPCILLGAELQQALAPKALTDLVDDALGGSWRLSKEEEKTKFARAKKLVQKHDRLEEAAERARRPKPD